MSEPQVHRCGKSIDGPKMGKHVVLWRKHCRNRVKGAGERCHLHRRRED